MLWCNVIRENKKETKEGRIIRPPSKNVPLFLSFVPHVRSKKKERKRDNTPLFYLLLHLFIPSSVPQRPSNNNNNQKMDEEIYFWQKVGMLAAILISSIVMGFLPLGLKKVNPILKKRLLSFGNCFAGGVFFAIGYDF